jgi:hypothetical protein
VTITLPVSPQVINVDNSAACVGTDDQPAYTNGTVSDTVEWKINSNQVSDFQVVFTKKSPSQGKERHFDKNKSKFTAITTPKNNIEVFEYIITVDLVDGANNTCDPHVIVIKGSGK